MVFSLAYHFLRDRESAEEVAQEVFLSLHRNLGSIQSPAHAGFWLRKVTVQRAFDEGRRRKRRPQVALQDIAEPAAAVRPGDPLLGETLRRLIATLGRCAAHGHDFAVPGRPGPDGNCSTAGHARSHREKPPAALSGAAAGANSSGAVWENSDGLAGTGITRCAESQGPFARFWRAGSLESARAKTPPGARLAVVAGYRCRIRDRRRRRGNRVPPASG